MAVVQPIAQSVPAFDATQSNTFRFVSNGGNQVVSNRLVIRNNDTGAEIYNKKIESYRFEHTIPPNTLKNGIYYNFYFKTYDVNNVESPASNVIPFRCYNTPTITIDNIPVTGIIESTTFEVNATYNQAQKELMDFAKFILYDQQENVLFESENIYNSNKPPFTLSYTFKGLDNDTNFKVSVKCVTLNKTIVESEKKLFTTRYFTPSMFSVIELENNCEDGYVKIKNNFKVVDYESNPPDIGTNPKYLHDGKLHLTESGTYIKWFQGFAIEKNFTLRLFLENPNLGELCILGDNGDKILISLIQEIPFGKESKQYCLELKCYNDINKENDCYYIYSNFVKSKEKLMLWARRIDNRFEIKLHSFNEPSSFIIWNGGSTVYWGEKDTGIYWGE